jgi:hypothetical protein
MAAPLVAQDVNAPKPEMGQITGTVTDVNNDVLSGASVVLEGPGLKEPRKLLSDDNGFFEFKELDPGTYHVTITAEEFADWTSPGLTINPGQYLILTDSKLHIAKAARRGSGLPEFLYFHGRAHAQQRSAGIRFAQVHTQKPRIRLAQKGTKGEPALTAINVQVRVLQLLHHFQRDALRHAADDHGGTGSPLLSLRTHCSSCMKPI